MPPVRKRAMPSTHAPFDLSDDAFRTLGADAVNLMIAAIAQDRVDPVLRPVSGRWRQSSG